MSDGRTDGWTDGQNCDGYDMLKAVAAFARKNGLNDQSSVHNTSMVIARNSFWESINFLEGEESIKLFYEELDIHIMLSK